MSKIKRIRIVLQDKLLNLAKQCRSVLFYDTTVAIQVRVHLIVSAKTVIHHKTIQKLTGFSRGLLKITRPAPNQHQTNFQPVSNAFELLSFERKADRDG